MNEVDINGILTVARMQSALNAIHTAPRKESERRAVPRFAVAGYVIVAVITESGDVSPHKAELLNVSEQGFGLESGRFYDVGMPILLGLANDAQMSWFLAAVCARSYVRDGEHRYGLRQWGRLEQSVAEAVLKQDAECVRGVRAMVAGILENVAR